MEFHELQILPPRSWEKFEDLCLDLFGRVWNDPTARTVRRHQTAGGSAGRDQTPTVPEGLRLGIAHTVVRGWREPSLRALTTPLLLRLIQGANGRLAEALQFAFASSDPIPADDYTRPILEAVLAHPAVLIARNGGNVVDRLKELLREVWNPELVHAVAERLIESGGQGPGDITTAWAGNSKDLVEIALTLHRLPATRSRGLDLFERLMTLEAYGVHESLGTLDRRPFR